MRVRVMENRFAAMKLRGAVVATRTRCLWTARKGRPRHCVRSPMTRPGKAVDNRVSLLGAADNSSLLPAPSVAEAQGSGGGDDRMRVVQEQVDGVKGVMQQNVNQMLENMDRTQHLETTTQELAGYPYPSPSPSPSPSP